MHRLNIRINDFLITNNYSYQDPKTKKNAFPAKNRYEVRELKVGKKTNLGSIKEPDYITPANGVYTTIKVFEDRTSAEKHMRKLQSRRLEK